MRLGLLLLFAAGCGRLAFDPTDPGVDADVEVHGPPSGLPVGVPTLAQALADPSATEARPFASVDLRELYFVSDRPGGRGAMDVWRATRENVEDPWGAPRPVVELNSVKDETGAALSGDGLTLYLSSARDGGFGGTDLWYATRAHADAPWSAPVHLPQLSSEANDDAPAPSADHRELIFHSQRAGTGRRDLYLATRSSPGAAWSAPQPIADLNTSADDADPFLAASGDLIFDSNRDDSYRELFVARRRGAGFEAPRRYDAFDSTRADADPWLSPDGTYLIFLSSRAGDDEIYEVLLAEPMF